MIKSRINYTVKTEPYEVSIFIKQTKTTREAHIEFNADDLHEDARALWDSVSQYKSFGGNAPRVYTLAHWSIADSDIGGLVHLRRDELIAPCELTLDEAFEQIRASITIRAENELRMHEHNERALEAAQALKQERQQRLQEIDRIKADLEAYTLEALPVPPFNPAPKVGGRIWEAIYRDATEPDNHALNRTDIVYQVEDLPYSAGLREVYEYGDFERLEVVFTTQKVTVKRLVDNDETEPYEQGERLASDDERMTAEYERRAAAREVMDDSAAGNDEIIARYEKQWADKFNEQIDRAIIWGDKPAPQESQDSSLTVDSLERLRRMFKPREQDEQGGDE